MAAALAGKDVFCFTPVGRSSILVQATDYKSSTWPARVLSRNDSKGISLVKGLQLQEAPDARDLKRSILDVAKLSLQLVIEAELGDVVVGNKVLMKGGVS